MEKILIYAALLPALVLGIFIYKKDKADKEPLSLLITLLVSGVVICTPVISVGTAIQDLLQSIFDRNSLTYLFLKAFVEVAFVEEGFKWLALIIVTKDNKNFNSVFDGMIYAIFVSLGFAGYENILYVLDGGIEVALIRAFTAVPGHVFDAVFMGYYFSWYHINKTASQCEKRLMEIGGITKDTSRFTYKKELALSLLIPVLAHGFYDFCCFVGTLDLVIIFYGFVIFLYVFCFRRVLKMSKGDMMDTKMALVMICNEYPIIRKIVGKIHDAERQLAGNWTAPVKPVEFEDVCDYIKHVCNLKLYKTVDELMMAKPEQDPEITMDKVETFDDYSGADSVKAEQAVPVNDVQYSGDTF